MGHELLLPCEHIRRIGQVLIRIKYFTKRKGLRKSLPGSNERTVNVSYHLYYFLGLPPDPVPISLNILVVTGGIKR